MTKEKLLSDIRPDMKLTMDFFKKIYGYGITTPEFIDEAIGQLEKVGCLKAREYYEKFKDDYEAKQHKIDVEVSIWYREQLDRQYEERRKKDNWKMKQQQKQKLNDLKEKLNYLKQNIQN
ncbi:MAG: hypothetical protein PHD70_13620 [Anaerostipes sp.]|nr:hypothetical protein [Anaerostipes sp.]